ncbi:MAG: hypothetical protein K6G12_03390 [Lachnospiraceae bacterium]|nr:hypothetical protein [Lachnospiraceae bacterium]
MKKQIYRRKTDKSIIRIISVMMCMLCWCFSFAGAFSYDDPVLNDEDHMIYRTYDPDNVSVGEDIVAAGTVDSVLDVKNFILKTSSDGKIKVSVGLTDNLSGISEGMDVRVYGTLKTSYNRSYKYILKAHHIETESGAFLKDDYYVPGGQSYSNGSSVTRNLPGDDISYRIPSGWEKVIANNDEKNRIFNIGDIQNGDCYYLNAIDSKNETECFIIYDFDYSRFLYDSDRNRTGGIEKAIVENICPKAVSGMIKNATFMPKNAVAGFEHDIDYYIAMYENSYSVEFVFVPLEDHMCVMLYIYNGEPVHLDDVLYVIKSLDEML